MEGVPRKIDLIGVEHGAVQREVTKKLANFATSNRNFLPAEEGSAYYAEPDEDGFYGIEDPSHLISNYAQLLMAYRKTCTFQDENWMGYYACAIFQLFMEVEQSDPLAMAMGKVLEYFTQNKTNEVFVLSEFFCTIFTAENRPYFHSSFWDSSREPYPSECISFFSENKASFDLIVQTIVFQLSQAIKEKFSVFGEIANPEELEEENIARFFQNPRETDFAEKVAENLRNLVFANNLKEIANQAKNGDIVCCIVGNKHVGSLAAILRRDRIFRVSEYNAVKNELPDYLNC